MIKLAPFFGGEFHVFRFQILFETLQLGGSRDRNDPRFLSKHPGKRDLGRSRSFPLTEFVEQIHQDPVCFHRLWGEARQGGAVVVTAVKFGVLVQSAGEITSAEWAVRNETDAEFLKCTAENTLGQPA